MNPFNRFFNKNPTGTRLKMVTQHGASFYAWNGKMYDSDIVRSCIRPFYKAIGKLVAKHIIDNGKELKVNIEPYIKILLEDPNPYMTGQMLQEKLAIQLKLNNNAFAYINRDDNGYANEIYPIPATFAEAVHLPSGYLDIKFTLKNGNILQFPYEDIIHIRQDFNEDDIFGTSQIKAISSLMNIVTTTDQGIVNAIKNSAVIRWLLKFSSSLRPEDLEKNAKDFADSFLSTESNGTGVAAVDVKADAQQIKQDDYVPNSSQMDRTTVRLYNLFGTNEKIVQSKYNEDEWNAYYESEIEPIAIQLANEYSRKIFSRRERAFGNKIVFESSSLQYAAMSTKLQLMQMVDRGAMTPNEWRKVMNLGPIEGGEKAIRRLDTAVVKEGGK
ncbi:phage portal protein [Sporanaerobium hydrogeniformans]|uniref:Phage portal protein n=1 Tax=Sporanaerobium hydrogeniformans TaxID=3072179 RepID=A0AC61DB12_9FIRM|nr:phage portal protein [Sporanaerobium hydrogeniformans]PHV69772.1 phage portal protein [Sporanaerobium hydrogeniformans]